MVFQVKNQRTAAPVVGEQESSGQDIEGEGLAFLKPKRSIAEQYANDPYGAELAQRGTTQYTLKTLNALKIVSPILCALMEKPGLDSPNDEMSNSFKTLIKETSFLAEKVCEKIDVDPTREKNFWIRNVLEKNFAEILRHQWVNTGKVDSEAILALFDEVLEVSQTVSQTTHFEDLDALSNVRLAVFRAVLPVLNEAKVNFDLYRDIEADLEHICEKLFTSSSEGVTKLADASADPANRAKLFYLLMQEAGQLYACAWRTEVKKIMQVMNSHTPEKLEKAVERYRNNGGFPLNRIDNDFDKFFNKLVIITERLVPAQKGAIDKRIKNKS